MVAVGEDLVLVGQVGATRIHQVDAGQTVLGRDLLRAEVLFYRHRIVGAALHGRVVGNNHDLLAHHPADPGDDTGGRRVAVIHAMGGGGADFEERRARIEQVRHPLARRHLAARGVAGEGLCATAPGGQIGGGTDRV